MKFCGRKIKLLIRYLLISTLIIGWVFSGWPMIHIFAQEATSTPETPPAATSTSPTAAATSTLEVATSTPQDITSNEEVEETPIPEPPQPAAPSLPPLKERKLNKHPVIAAGAKHNCRAENFKIDISGRTSAQARIALGGKKVRSGEIEIGSLPLGIDIQFSENRDYLRGVSQNDGAFNLEISNQEGSQKGNFSIPILYTDKESGQTTVCQINVINF